MEENKRAIDFEEFQKVAKYIYKKYFYNCHSEKEDLLSCAYLRMFRDASKYDPTRSSWGNYLCELSIYAMKQYMYTHFNKETPLILSLDIPIKASEEKDMFLIDTIADETEPIFDFDMPFLQKAIAECGEKVKVSKNNRYSKQTIHLIAKAYNDAEISKILVCSREFVRTVRNKFKSILKDYLIEKEYFDR